MEYVAGGSLRDVLRDRGRLPEDEVRRITGQAALGLFVAARGGVIHRDVKPDNLLLSQDGTVKISDFGLFKHDHAEKTITRSGEILGTPAYIAPEQWADSRQADHRSDLYSLGCSTFELLAGRPPFVGPSIPNFMTQHLRHAPPRVRSLVPEVSTELDALLARLLAKNPQERVQSGLEVASALKVEGLSQQRVRAPAPPPPIPPRVPEDPASQWLHATEPAGAVGHAEEPIYDIVYPSTVSAHAPRILPWLLFGLLSVTALVVAVVVFSPGPALHPEALAAELLRTLREPIILVLLGGAALLTGLGLVLRLLAGPLFGPVTDRRGRRRGLGLPAWLRWVPLVCILAAVGILVVQLLRWGG